MYSIKPKETPNQPKTQHVPTCHHIWSTKPKQSPETSVRSARGWFSREWRSSPWWWGWCAGSCVSLGLWWLSQSTFQRARKVGQSTMQRPLHARLRNLVFILWGREGDNVSHVAKGEEGRIYHTPIAGHLTVSLDKALETAFSKGWTWSP